MTVWVFVVLLSMASFDGPVKVEVTTSSEASCNKVRRVLIRAGIDEKAVKPCVQELKK